MSEQLTIPCEDTDWHHVDARTELLGDHKITSNSQDDNETKYNELLRELDTLKRIVIELSSAISKQNEALDQSIDLTSNNREQMKKINQQLEQLRLQSQPSRWRYIKDYIIPLSGLVGINTPFFVMFGLKYGLFSVPCSWLVTKIINYTM